VRGSYDQVMKEKDRFWNVDLLAISREWILQLQTLMMTALAFVAIAMPVLISGLVLWYVAGFPILF
jgi:hypothetical protein